MIRIDVNKISFYYIYKNLHNVIHKVENVQTKQSVKINNFYLHINIV